jgi:hypothetical protein
MQTLLKAGGQTAEALVKELNKNYIQYEFYFATSLLIARIVPECSPS